MNIRISACAENLPAYMINNKNIAKKYIKLPSAPKGMEVMSASALAMILPADSFLKKTNAEPMKLTDYIERNGRWYKIHYPMDGSDYYHEIPCDNPYKNKNQYYPGS